MTPAQIEQLRFALSNPRYEGWTAPPIIPGSWRELTGEMALNTIIAICEWLEDERDVKNLAIEWTVDRVRVRNLTCYEDTVLVELAGHAGYGRPGLINVIVHEDGMALLDGTSAVIHDLNMELPPILDTHHQRLDYLHLFMNWVHASEGRFQPVSTQEDLLPRLLPEAGKAAEAISLSPFTETAPEEETEALAHYTGTVLYGGSLFQAVMAIYPRGLVEMIDDDVLLTDLPVREEGLIGPMIVSRM